MLCSKCGSENAPNMKFCGECAAPLAAACPKCGFDNPTGRKFCGQCAAPLSVSTSSNVKDPGTSPDRPSSTRVAPQTADSLEGERKTVTVLFADIKGSMDLIEELDPEEARAIVDPALKLMMDAVHRYEGYVAQSTGDGIFALFGAPVAHEDHPQRALYAALRIQEEMQRYSMRLREAGHLPIEARVGVNTGEVVVRSIRTGDAHTEYVPIGHSTGLAARMQALAPTGSIAATEAVRKLCEGYFAFKALGPTQVKGVSEPVPVFEVTGLGPLRTRLQRAAGRGFARFVGREREMAEMKRAAEQAKAKHGQVVAVVADAGVGKSRLFHEFKALASAGWKVLETLAVSHGKTSAYLPVIDLLRNYFEIQSGDDEHKRREKICGKVLTLDHALEDTLAYLLGLLGLVEDDDLLAQMDPQVRRRRTLDAVKRIFLRESLNQPLMLVFEDLHWIDEETQALFDLLADSIGTARILMLANYRAGYTHQWGAKSYYAQIRLDPLGEQSAEEMLDALLGTAPELAPLKRLIVDKTEGNPFFIEETVQVLVEEGCLLRDGTVRLTKPLSELGIPPTVQAILAARVDRLPPDLKELLQTGAVIGKEFQFRLVQQVTGRSKDELERMLSALQSGEFIYEQPTSRDIGYSFKHILTQEVAYGSLLVDRRKLLHERTGAGIESLFKDTLDDHLGELAFHYSRSFNLKKAVSYLYSAGRQLAQRSAYSAALAYLNQSLQLSENLLKDRDSSRLQLRLQIAIAQSFRFTKGWAAPEVESTFLRARDLCSQFGNTPELFSVLAGLRQLYFQRQDFATARRLAEELVTLGQTTQDPNVLAWGYTSLGQILYCMGDLTGARARCEQAIAIPVSSHTKKQEISGPKTYALCFMALVLWWLGYPDKARKVSHEALSMAEKLSRPFFLATALFLGSIVSEALQDESQGLKLAERAIVVASQRGFSTELAISTFFRGRALVGLAKVDEGIDEMRHGIALFNSTGADTPNYMAVPLADALRRSGDLEDGLRLLAEAQAAAHKTGELFYEPELCRVRGDLIQLLGPDGDAETSYRVAIRIAREQSAKSWELRAATSLARLLERKGRSAQARAVLVEVYGWFTEGFQSADLKDAKALLDQLS
jgi:class 3 adenylate cyclase/tetratricopeptide (TPR) repeat protein